jgi:hypothetical protein
MESGGGGMRFQPSRQPTRDFSPKPSVLIMPCLVLLFLLFRPYSTFMLGSPVRRP